MRQESFFLVGENNSGDGIKKVIVIGSTGTIGEAVSALLLSCGFLVVGIGRKISPFDQKKENYIHHILNLQNVELLEATLSNILKKNKEIFGLVHCAGLGEFSNIENLAVSKIKEMLDVNLLSVIVTAKVLIPYFKKINKGKLILIGSEAGLKGGQKGSVYSASKFGLRGFSQSIREETARNNIFVTVINPGMVRGKFFDDKNFYPGKSKENAIEPSDIAKVVNYLLDEKIGMVFDEINVSQMKKVIEFNKN